MSKLNPLPVLILLLTPLAASSAQSGDLPPGPLQAKMKTACLECHDSGIILQQRLGKSAWAKEVDKMIKWGALIDPGDREAFIEYLSTNFPADKEPYVAPRTATAKKRQGGR
jgi:hypothetical protein